MPFVSKAQDSKELSKLHGKISKDLTRASGSVGKKNNNDACPYGEALKLFTRYDEEDVGFLKVNRIFPVHFHAWNFDASPTFVTHTWPPPYEPNRKK